MNNLNNYYNCLPIEITSQIHDYLSLGEKTLTIPQVCKNWYLMNINKHKKNLTDLINEVGVRYGFSIKQQVLFSRFIANSNLISDLILNKKTIFLDHHLHINCKPDAISNYHLNPMIRKRDSEGFFLSWNAETFKLSVNEDENNFRALCCFRLLEDKSNSSDIPNRYLRVFSGKDIQQYNWFYWKQFADRECSAVIGSVLDFEITNHITRIAEANLLHLVPFNLQDLSNELVFKCDNLGQIIKIEYFFQSYFAIFSLQLKEGNLHWKVVESYMGLKSYCHEPIDALPSALNTEKILQCCVFTKTALLFKDRIAFLKQQFTLNQECGKILD